MKKQYISNLILKIVLTILSVVSLAIFIENSVRCTIGAQNFSPDKFKPYNYSNMFNGWVNLTYLTYLGTIFTFFYCITDLVYYIKNKRNLNSTLFTFTVCNEFFIFVIYSLYQIVLPDSLSLANFSASVMHNFSVNLIIHIAFPILYTIYFLFNKTERKSKVNTKALIITYLSFFALYFVIVKVLGEFILPYRWFPYPIFSADSIWMLLFGSLETFNKIWGSIIVAIVWGVIEAIICFSAWGFSYIEQNRFDKENTKTQTYKGIFLGILILTFVILIISIILHTI